MERAQKLQIYAHDFFSSHARLQITLIKKSRLRNQLEQEHLYYDVLIPAASKTPDNQNTSDAPLEIISRRHCAVTTIPAV